MVNGKRTINHRNINVSHDTGIIHLHRERVGEEMKHRIEGAENIAFRNIKDGLLRLERVYTL